MVDRGIILAGGSGSRLYPMTSVVCKQLLPVYDKPLLFYPIATLMLFGIRRLLIISTPHDLPMMKALLGDGSRYGVSFSYEIQEKPAGIAQALLIGEKFIDKKPTALILGDNLFYGSFDFLREARSFQSGARIFAYAVRDPERYGVVELDSLGNAQSIIEKPEHPKSHYAVTGLYLYDEYAVEMTRKLTPSGRGELEITDLNRKYLESGKLSVVKLGRGIAWLDTGTPESMLEAGEFIATVEKRQGQKIGCLEEVAMRMKFQTPKEAHAQVSNMPKSSYRAYIEQVISELD